MSAFEPKDWKITRGSVPGIVRPDSEASKRDLVKSDLQQNKPNSQPSNVEKTSQLPEGKSVAKTSIPNSATESSLPTTIKQPAKTVPPQSREASENSRSGAADPTSPHDTFQLYKNKSKQLSQLMRGGQPNKADAGPVLPKGPFANLIQQAKPATSPATPLPTTPVVKTAVPILTGTLKTPSQPASSESEKSLASSKEHSAGEQQMIAQKTPSPFIEKPQAVSEKKLEIKTSTETAKGLKAVEGGVGISGIGGAQEFNTGTHSSGFGEPDQSGLSHKVGAAPFPIVLDSTSEFPETAALFASLSLLNIETGGTALERTQTSVGERIANQTEVGWSERAPDVPLGAAYITANGRGKVIA